MNNDFIDSDIIFNNKFAKEISNFSLYFVKKEKSDKKDEFLLEIFYKFDEISKKFNDINYSYFHIINYPDNEKFREIFPIKDYITYHLEIYLINIVALFDRILHLINLLYELNLKGDKLKLINIKKAEKVDVNIIKILEDFFNSINDVRKQQNHIKHQGTLDLPELNKVNMYEFLIKNSTNLDDEKKQLMKDFIKIKFEKFKLDYKDKMFKNTQGIVDFINILFDELYIIFEGKLNEYNK